MRKSDIKVGEIYFIRHSGSWCKVRVESIKEVETFRSRTATRYYCTKLATGRQITVKSAAKFIYNVATTATGGTNIII